MNIKKINKEIINALIKNADLLKLIKELNGLLEQIDNYNNNKNLIRLTSIYTKVNNRVIFDNFLKEIGSDDYYAEKSKIGLNNYGLGVLKSWSEQLAGFSSERNSFYTLKTKEIIFKILNNDEIFNKVLENINKDYIDKLKELKEFLIKNNAEKIYEEKDIFDVEVDKIKLFMNVTKSCIYGIKINNNEIYDSYLKNILNFNVDITQEEHNEELKKIDNCGLDFNLRSLKVFEYILLYKKELKTEFKNKIKMAKNEIKHRQKINNFIDNKLKIYEILKEL